MGCNREREREWEYKNRDSTHDDKSKTFAQETDIAQFKDEWDATIFYSSHLDQLMHQNM